MENLARRPLASLFPLCLLLLTSGGHVRATDVTWTGNSSTIFSTAANWSVAPQSGDVLIFGAAGSSGLLLNDDLAAGFNLGGLIFNGPDAFVIGGASFALAGNLVNLSTSLQTISNGFTLAGPSTFTTTAGGGNLKLGGAIGGAGGITVAGGGTLTLTGANTYAGGTAVSGGMLQLGEGTAPSALRGGAGANGAAGVRTTGTSGPENNGGPGAAGDTSLIVNSGALLNVSAQAIIAGGAGGAGGVGGDMIGGPNSFIPFDGGSGGAGGTAVVVNNGSWASLPAQASITGGGGGTGGNTNVGTSPGFPITARYANGGGGGAGGTAVLFNSPSAFLNSGTITGGAGGARGLGKGSLLSGDGAAGLVFSQGGSLTNDGTAAGGAGGAGSAGQPSSSPGGESYLATPGAQGGTGVAFGASGTVSNSGTISGGAGGVGGSIFTGSGAAGGHGGIGASFLAGGTVVNSGTISGGPGGAGGSGTTVGATGSTGVGISISGGVGTLTNQGGALINGSVVMGNFANRVTLETGSRINGALNLGTNTSATLTFTGNGFQVYSAAVTGTTAFAGAVTKEGPGTWTLDTILTYAGPTAVNAGTLRLTGTLGNAATSTAVTIASGATLGGEGTIGDAGSLTLSNGSVFIADASTAGAFSVGTGSGGNLTLFGAVIVDLSGAPASVGNGQTIRLLNYSGTLSGSGANFSTARLRNGSVSTGTSHQIDLTFDTKGLTWAGNVQGNASAWDVNTTANWTGAEKFFSADGVTFDESGTAKTVTVETVVIPSTLTFSNSTGAYMLSGAGRIQAGGSLTHNGAGAVTINVPVTAASLAKSGTGTLTLAAPSAYTGATTISGGTLSLTSTLTGTVISTSGAGVLLQDATGAVGGATSLSFSGSGTSVLAGANTYTGPTAITGGTLSLAGTLTGTAISTSGTGILSQTSTGAIRGAVSLTLGGSGTSILAGANTFTGPTTLTAGTLVLNNGAAGTTTSSALGTGALIINGGALDSTVAGVVLGTNNPQTWNADFTFLGTQSLNLGVGAVVLGGNRQVTVSAGSLTVGAVSGPYSLTKAGAGTLTLTGANAYTDTTTVNAGTLSLQNAAASILNSLTIANGATLSTDVPSGANQRSLTGNLTLTGGTLGANANVSDSAAGQFLLTNAGQQVFVSGDNQSTIAAEMHMAGTHIFNVADGAAPVDLLVSGKVSHYHTVAWGGIRKTGAGTMSLTSSMDGTNSAGASGIYGLGGFELAGGTLRFSGSPGYSAFSPASKAGYFLADFAANSTLSWATGNTKDVSVNGNLRIRDAVTATFDTNGNNVTLATAIVVGAIGNGTLNKIGSGVLTLGAANAYTGPTVVLGGTLAVDGSIVASSGVAVSAGAKLGGHGRVSALSGAGLVAPDVVGVLTASTVDPSGGLDFTFEMTQPGSPAYNAAAASGNDVLHLTGATPGAIPFSLALSSTNLITLDFSAAALQLGQVYRGGFFTDAATANSLLDGASFAYAGLGGGFAIQYDGLVSESSAAFSTGTVNNGKIMQFTVIPEPAGATLALLGLGPLLLRWRNRRASAKRL